MVVYLVYVCFRLKGLCVCPALQEDEKCKKWLCLCSSDGHIKIFKIDEVGVGIHSSRGDHILDFSTKFFTPKFVQFGLKIGEFFSETRTMQFINFV